MYRICLLFDSTPPQISGFNVAFICADQDRSVFPRKTVQQTKILFHLKCFVAQVYQALPERYDYPIKRELVSNSLIS